MSGRVEVPPPLLEWARARSGIPDEDWDRRFPTFEAWLAGETAPTLKQLDEFARKTHTPVGFFFLDTPACLPGEPEHGSRDAALDAIGHQLVVDALERMKAQRYEAGRVDRDHGAWLHVARNPCA